MRSVSSNFVLLNKKKNSFSWTRLQGVRVFPVKNVLSKKLRSKFLFTCMKPFLN